MVNIAPRPLYPRERTVVLTLWEAEWASLPVRTVMEKKYLPLSVFEGGTIHSVRYSASKRIRVTILVVSLRAVKACGKVEVWPYVFLTWAVQRVSGQLQRVSGQLHVASAVPPRIVRTIPAECKSGWARRPALLPWRRVVYLAPAEN